MRSEGYNGRQFKLMYNDGVTEVRKGQIIELELHGILHQWIVHGGRAPHNESSAGRIEVKYDASTPHTQEFYPSVFGTKWVKV
jgi:hypothetical protein